MIPKIIHFCWLSKDPYPELITKCIASWKNNLSDYEIWLWDLNRFNIEQSKWCKDAFEKKKYAFAADYIRCFALYNYGGIYLDSDVEVLKKFDDLLNLPYFLGKEATGGWIEAATMGAEAGHPLFKKMLDYYDNNQFINADGSLNQVTLPALLKRIAQDEFEIVDVDDCQNFNYDAKKISIFPLDFFSPLVWGELKYLTNRTYSIHHFTGSWKEGRVSKVGKIIENLFGLRFKKKLSYWYIRLRYGKKYFENDEGMK